MAWTPFFLKITILCTGPQLLHMVYNTSCKPEATHLDDTFSPMLTISTRFGVCYRGNGVDGVHDGKEQDVVDTWGVARVPGPRDLLTGRIVDVAGPASNVHLVVIGIRHRVARATHVLVLHQSLALVRHQHHIATQTHTYRYTQRAEKNL